MVILRVACPDAGVASESATFTVKLDVPAAVGVPEITPEEEDSESPAGSAPVMMLHV
jgi:phosphohistidine swiveling domain-containing protein